MKKLLLTTAIAGVMVSGSAFAQTSITGELRLNYKTVSDATAAAGAVSTASVEGKRVVRPEDRGAEFRIW